MKPPTLSGLLFAASAAAKTYYFDSAPGTDTFTNLSSIAQLPLHPGDNILLKRGSHFHESLRLATSGTSSSPITVGAYGPSHLPLPVITASDLNGILLNGTSHVTLQDLEVTNPGDNATARRGVYIYAQDAGPIVGVTVQRLYIHDVTGRMPSTTGGQDISVGKYAGASGGIVIEAAGNSTPTYFQGVTVANNVLRRVSREGIYTWSNWCQRDALAAFWKTLCFRPWYASTGFKVHGNKLFDIGGDGIVITGNVDAQTTSNTVTVFNKNSGGNNAGIWTANSDGSYFARNLVSGGQTDHDGMAYDVDHSTSGTVYEYNVSHDNEGGFMLLCPYDKPTRNFTVRYNLSVNDKARFIQICPGDLVDGEVYKNTAVMSDTNKVVLAPSGLNLDLNLTDNIIGTIGSGHGTWQLDSSIVMDNNLFSGYIDAISATTHNIHGPPAFAAAGLRDPNAYLLVNGSGAFDRGVVISGDAKADFFGNGIRHKNAGFYAGGVTNAPQWVSSFDDGTTTGWETKGVSVVADPAGDTGKSAALATGGVLARSYKPGSVRFDARLWFTSGSAKPSVQVGGAKVVFDLTDADVGVWQVFELIFSGDGANATLGGRKVKASVGRSCRTVVVTAGSATMYVDDTFLVSL